MFSVMQFLMTLSASSVALAQEVAAPAAATPPQPAAWMQFVPFVVIIGVFYFFLIRPQAKKQRETQSFLSALKVGDLVITNSGLLGRITGLADQIATLEIANGVQVKMLRSQILMPQSSLQEKKEGK